MHVCAHLKWQSLRRDIARITCYEHVFELAYQDGHEGEVGEDDVGRVENLSAHRLQAHCSDGPSQRLKAFHMDLDLLGLAENQTYPLREVRRGLVRSFEMHDSPFNGSHGIQLLHPTIGSDGK